MADETKATDEAQADLTGPQQIEVLQRLTQQAAGWLIELNGRTVRDHNEIPRDADGRYNARDLLKWAAERVPRPKLDDADYERLLLVLDQFIGQWHGDITEGMAVGTWDALQALETKHGDGVRVLLADLLADWLEKEADYWREWEPKLPTAAEVRAELTKQKRDHDDYIAECIRLRVVVKCEDCKRLRHGRRWDKRTPPADYIVKGTVCPDCMARNQAS